MRKVGLAVVWLLACAYVPVHATVLSSVFGVTLSLDEDNRFWDDYQDAWSYPMKQSSYVPANIGHIDYVVNDWWGEWSAQDMDLYQTGAGAGQHPAGSEPYDVEAIYFTDDPHNLYIAVVTSVEPPPGRIEDRIWPLYPLVVTGDLSLNRGWNPTRGDGWSYDYGVNINLDVRPTDPNDDATSSGADPSPGLYRTLNTDWYLGTPNYTPLYNGDLDQTELTNFDPVYSGLTEMGDVTVNYYEYLFPGGLKETLYPTYIIEVTIPRSVLGGLPVGTQLGVQWVSGCRNDADETHHVIRLDGDVDTEPIPEPGTLALTGCGLAALILTLRRRRRD